MLNQHAQSVQNNAQRSVKCLVDLSSIQAFYAKNFFDINYEIFFAVESDTFNLHRTNCASVYASFQNFLISFFFEWIAP